MNRAPKDRRITRRPGSPERRGNQQVRGGQNLQKAARIRENRRLWKANEPLSGGNI